jgi:type IV pilus assembly protein PilA
MMKKYSNKKGITLVEVIVVLIIMAVLSGILVASYTGYIDKAKNDSALVEARAVYLAASTKYHEYYATSASATWTAGDDDKIAIETLAGVKAGSVTAVSAADKKISAITYKASNGKTCTYNGTSWTVS